MDEVTMSISLSTATSLTIENQRLEINQEIYKCPCQIEGFNQDGQIAEKGRKKFQKNNQSIEATLHLISIFTIYMEIHVHMLKF